jgi:hypothetical protein
MKEWPLKGFLKERHRDFTFVLLLGAWIAYFLLTTEPPIYIGRECSTT